MPIYATTDAEYVEANLIPSRLLCKDVALHYRQTVFTGILIKNHTLYSDRSVITNRCVPHNRPDIIRRDKDTNKAYITENEKNSKDLELGDELKKLWDLESVTILPLLLSTSGISKSLQRNPDTFNIKQPCGPPTPKSRYVEHHKNSA